MEVHRNPYALIFKPVSFSRGSTILWREVWDMAPESSKAWGTSPTFKDCVGVASCSWSQTHGASKEVRLPLWSTGMAKCDSLWNVWLKVRGRRETHLRLKNYWDWTQMLMVLNSIPTTNQYFKPLKCPPPNGVKPGKNPTVISSYGVKSWRPS